MCIPESAIGVSVDGISLKNGEHKVLPDLEHKACQVPSIQLAKQFVAWYNQRLGFSEASAGRFAIPSRQVVEEYEKFGSLPKNILENALLIGSSKNVENSSNLYLIRKEGISGRASGFEF